VIKVPFSRTQIACLFATVLCISLSIKYKEIGAAAIRPYHLFDLLIVSFVALYLASQKIVRRVHFHPLSLTLYALVGYIFSLSLVAEGRGWKDGLYIVANSLPFYWIACYAWINFREDWIVSSAKWVACVFAVLSFVSAVFCWFGLKASLGFLELAQSSSYLARAHGFLGDPTSLGVSAALCFFLMIYKINGHTPSQKDFSWNILIMTGSSAMAIGAILLAGSRMAIFVCITVVLYLLALKQVKIRLLMVSVFAGILLFAGLLEVRANMILPKTDPQIYIDNSFRMSNGSIDIQNDGRYESLFKILPFFQKRTLPEKIYGCGFSCVNKEMGRSFFIGYVENLLDYGIVFSSVFILMTLLAFRYAFRLGLRCAVFPLALIIFGYELNLFLPLFFSPFFNFPFFATLTGLGAIAALSSSERRKIYTCPPKTT